MADAGFTEIQLLGQNVNSYHDPEPRKKTFAELLAAIGETPGIRRVRFHHQPSTRLYPRHRRRD